MSDQRSNEFEYGDLELRLVAAGRSIAYPSTPDITRAVLERITVQKPRPVRFKTTRLGFALAVLLALLAGLYAIPSVRAQVLEFLQIGIVRIFPLTQTATSTPTFTPSRPVETPRIIGVTGGPPVVTASKTPPPTPTIPSTPMPIASLLQLDGLTSLEEAAQRADFTIRLPAYPPDLGDPDRVYFQDLGGQMLVLVWFEQGDTNQIRLSLHEYFGKEDLSIEKGMVRLIQETTVNGWRAVWVEGPYRLKLRNGQIELVRLIEGKVLIWEEGGITYRLETNLPLEEAERIGESLRPID